MEPCIRNKDTDVFQLKAESVCVEGTVSRLARKASVYIICGLLLGNTYVFALEGRGSDFGRNFVIRQEIYQAGGVLVCRAVPIDEKIRDLIIFNNIKSIEDYAQWLEENIKYERDREGDNWLTAEEMLQKKYGDCEDFAFLNKAVLRVLGYQPKVLIVFRLFRSHALCVFIENGHYTLIDNAKLKRTQVGSILELANYLFKEYACYSIGVARPKDKKWDILFRRTEIANQGDGELGNE